MTIRKIVLGGAITAALAMGAWAHSGATGVVKERMDAMKSMGKAVKAIKPMMTGEAAYDADAVRKAARTIADQAGDDMTALFPEGSDEAPSEVLPTVWSDQERFEDLADALQKAALGLEKAAGNGRQAGQGGMMSDQSGMMGQGGMMGDQPGMMGQDDMMGDQSGMMGQGNMMGGTMSADHIGQMPADGAFTMMAQVCSACHDRFREEDD